MKRLLCIFIIVFFTSSGSVSFSANSTIRTVAANSSDKTGVNTHQAGETWTEPMTGMEFVWVPAGCFQMGTPKGGAFNYAQKEELKNNNIFVAMLKVVSVLLPVGCSSLRTSIPQDFDKYTQDERPVHKVCLDGFWIGKYEVTQEQWIKIMGKNPSFFPKGNDYPVEQVSWDDITEFTNRFNKKAGVTLSLPTEAQWEYAARSGGKNEIYPGSNDVRKVAWYYENSGGRPHKVGTKLANGLGIYDMSGNLREWCKDMYAKDAYSKHSRNNPLYLSDKESRVIRGGSWYVNPCDTRCASRGWDWKPHRNSDVGFRLVREQ